MKSSTDMQANSFKGTRYVFYEEDSERLDFCLQKKQKCKLSHNFSYYVLEF